MTIDKSSDINGSIMFVCLFDLGFNATFNNISVISRRLVLLIEEAGVPGESHRPWAGTL